MGGSTQACKSKCYSLPGGVLQDGCALFAEWGWTSGDPQLNYQVVDCPAAYLNIIRNAFDGNGIKPFYGANDVEEVEKVDEIIQ